MDYSSLPNDNDHLPGTSPWQSSPKPVSRSSFINSERDSTPSPPSAKRSSYASTSQGHSEEDGSDQDTVTEDRNQSRATENALPENGTSSESAHKQQQRPQEENEHEDQYQQYHEQRSQQSPHQQRGTVPNRYHGNTRSVQRANLPQYKLQAKITGLERTGRNDPVLKFDVHVGVQLPLNCPVMLMGNPKTNLPKFRTTQFRDVRRTHSEFIKLADHLISSNPEAFVPAVPPPLTAAGAGTVEDESRVKNSLQRWFNYVCGNDVLMRDEEMRFFVQSDSGYSPVIRMKQPATGVRRKVIKQFAPPPDDTPELQEARPIIKLFYLGTMETGQKVDRVVKSRRGKFFQTCFIPNAAI